jgi:hypothetical protein
MGFRYQFNWVLVGFNRMSNVIRLVERDGDLYYPDTVKDSYGESGPILVYVYPAGDCDTIHWPKPHMNNLRNVLYDDRECGYFEDNDVIELPDGTVVSF